MKVGVLPSVFAIILTLGGYVHAAADANAHEVVMDDAFAAQGVGDLEFIPDELDNSYENGEDEGSYDLNADYMDEPGLLEIVDEEDYDEPIFLQLEDDSFLQGIGGDDDDNDGDNEALGNWGRDDRMGMGGGLDDDLMQLADIMDGDMNYQPIKKHVPWRVAKGPSDGDNDGVKDYLIPDEDDQDNVNPDNESSWKHKISKRRLLIAVALLCVIIGVVVLVHYAPTYLPDAKDRLVGYFNYITGRGSQLPVTEEAEPLTA